MKLYDKVILYTLYLIMLWLIYEGQGRATIRNEMLKHVQMMMNEIDGWDDDRFPGSKP